MLRPQRAREIPNKMCQHGVRHCGVHALDPCTLGRPMERLLVWVAVVDWASPQRLIRKVFAAWLIAHVSAVRGYLEAEVQRLQSKLVKKTSSIWEMRKPALVEAAIKNLGWSRDKAESETVGQLRLYLKEAKTAKEPIKNHLPTGLQRMKHEELQEEAMNRGLEITKGKGARSSVATSRRGQKSKSPQSSRRQRRHRRVLHRQRERDRSLGRGRTRWLSARRGVDGTAPRRTT